MRGAKGRATSPRVAQPPAAKANEFASPIPHAERSEFAHRGGEGRLGDHLHAHAGLGQHRLLPEVARVLHPALPSCPGHATWRRDFRGASGVFTIVLQPWTRPLLPAAVEALQRFVIGASWGATRSIVAPSCRRLPAARCCPAAWPHSRPGPRTARSA
jgi:hypothetical protein